MNRLGWRGVALALVFLGMLLVPTVALAQAGFYVTPSFSLSEVFDDNVRASASKVESDFITRFTPAIQAGYQSAPLTILSRYSFDSEVYADHPEFTDAQVRQAASIDVKYLPIRPLTLSFIGSYAETQTPRDLNVLTGLEVGRGLAQSFSFGPSIAYQFDPLTTATGGYTFTRSELAGGVSSDTHATNLGLDRRITSRDTASLAYAFRDYNFSGDPSSNSGTTTSHVMTLGWTREITPLTSVALRVGPRFSEGAVEPEVSASIVHKLEAGQVSFAYTRSQNTVTGQAGTVDTESFTASITYQLLRLLQVGAAPAFYRNTQGNSETKVYSLVLNATYQITEWLSLAGSYQFTLQQGILASAPGTAGSQDQEISHNIVSLSLVATYPYRVY